jgi:hypothetical protein
MPEAVEPVVAAETMGMEVVKDLELDRPATMTLLEVAPVVRVAAMVVA